MLTCSRSRLCLCLRLVRDQVSGSIVTNLCAIERNSRVVAVNGLVTTEVTWGGLELCHTIVG